MAVRAEWELGPVSRMVVGMQHTLAGTVDAMPCAGGPPREQSTRGSTLPCRGAGVGKGAPRWTDRLLFPALLLPSPEQAPGGHGGLQLRGPTPVP